MVDRSLKLLADENIAAPLVQALRTQGNDVTYVAEMSPGLTDDEVLSLAKREHRLLLTEDKDFGELVFRLKQEPPGVVLLRLGDARWETQHQRLRHLFDHHSEKLAKTYTVVEARRFRFRLL